MPEVSVMAEPMPGSGAMETPAGGERDAVSGRFLKGHEKLGGRKVGARNAAKCLDRAAPKLARHMIARSFKSDSVLCKTMDKILPDASVGETGAGIVPIFVIVGPRPVEEDATVSGVFDADASQAGAETTPDLDAQPSAGTSQ